MSKKLKKIKGKVFIKMKDVKHSNLYLENMVFSVDKKDFKDKKKKVLQTDQNISVRRKDIKKSYKKGYFDEKNHFGQSPCYVFCKNPKGSKTTFSIERIYRVG